MSTKQENLTDPNSCLGKAADDEPIFVLRARDPIAAHIVREWAKLAETYDLHESEKISRARDVADAMGVWRAAQELPPGAP